MRRVYVYTIVVINLSARGQGRNWQECIKLDLKQRGKVDASVPA
jgi:hypothetical protein